MIFKRKKYFTVNCDHHYVAKILSLIPAGDLVLVYSTHPKLSTIIYLGKKQIIIDKIREVCFV